MDLEARELEDTRRAAAEGSSRPPRWKVRLPRWLGFAGAPRKERRSGVDRRRVRRARLRSFYCSLFQLETHTADVDVAGNPPPVPAIDFSDPQRKLEVLLSLHNNIRDAIQRWEDRIFAAFMLTVGAILSAVAFYLEHRDGLDSRLFGSAVATFGVAGLAYLYLAAKAHANNGILLVKIEAALGFCQRGVYVKNEYFFGYTGFWVQDWRTPILLLIHTGVVVFSTSVVLLS
jgi:hypothetical protein